jgi:hypothetical protein
MDDGSDRPPRRGAHEPTTIHVGVSAYTAELSHILDAGVVTKLRLPQATKLVPYGVHHYLLIYN